MMNRLARDAATNKQKWAIELCEQYATAFIVTGKQIGRAHV